MAANMSRALRPHVIVATALPVAGFQLLSTVKAGSAKVHPRELDIYKEPEGAKFEAVDAEPTPLEENVSKVRKVVWNYMDRIKDRTAKVKDTVNKTGDKALEFVDLVQRDRTFQMKVGAISAGVIAGTLLAGRGRRPFRRVFFATGLGTIAASVCYPKEAVDLSLTSFEKLKNFVNEQRVKFSQPADEPGKKPVELEAATSKESESQRKANSLDKAASSETNKAEVSGETVGKEQKDKVITVNTTSEGGGQSVEVEGDLGMSNSEDKDLYSTRS